MTIVSVRKLPPGRLEIEQVSQEMYNLTVDEAHTFFVGEGQWLVHNTELCDTIWENMRRTDLTWNDVDELREMAIKDYESTTGMKIRYAREQIGTDAGRILTLGSEKYPTMIIYPAHFRSTIPHEWVHFDRHRKLNWPTIHDYERGQLLVYYEYVDHEFLYDWQIKNAKAIGSSVNFVRTLENVRLRQRKRRSLASNWQNALTLRMSQAILPQDSPFFNSILDGWQAKLQEAILKRACLNKRDFEKMTTQIQDRLMYKGNRYNTIGVNGKGLISPLDFGISVATDDSACRRGYHSEYSCIDVHLLLTAMALTNGGQYENKAIDGVYPSGDPESFIEGRGYFAYKYNNLKIATPYSGGLLVAKDRIQAVNAIESPRSYETILELLFDRGRLVKTIDQSEMVAKDRYSHNEIEFSLKYDVLYTLHIEMYTS